MIRLGLAAVMLCLTASCGDVEAPADKTASEIADALVRALNEGSMEGVIATVRWVEIDPTSAEGSRALGAATSRVKGLSLELAAEREAQRFDDNSAIFGVRRSSERDDKKLAAPLALVREADGWLVPERALIAFIDELVGQDQSPPRDHAIAVVQMHALRSAIDMYRMQHEELPESLAILEQEDPRTGQATLKKVPEDPWGNDYAIVPGASGEYRLRSAGPDGVMGTEDDITSK